MMETTQFNPIQLKRARVARGKTMKVLAEETGISRQMISNYELGKTVPSGLNLVKLISVLNFPKNYFSATQASNLHGATFFRSQNAATKRARDMQSVRLSFQNDIYTTLSQYVNFPKVDLPESLDMDVDDITNDNIKFMAMRVRDQWDLGTKTPIENLIQTAEIHGIVVVKTNMTNDKLDAVSEIIEGRPFIMLTDNGESAVRRRFNVAHELGHIVLHAGIESIHDFTSQQLKNTIERQANLFASTFLMPDDAFVESLLSTSLDYYIKLKQYWKASIQSMIYKTYQLGLINDDQKLYLNKKISWNKWRKIEPLDNILEIENPTLFGKVFNMIIDHKVVSQADLLSELKLPFDELECSLGIQLATQKNISEPKLRLL
ncbi:XRE family transcriptional regulator [Lactiplantibacillus plantarum]|uniref:Zinc metallopeptidase n=1 Tax=Lactiplantibacillus plantarum (strain ATCC BAA-793 / NCIMB 8826 / WCFS1) TaxID=220668 RepID=F9UPW2_LACPL|nr:transcriptional regulator [Lactiplantibacillus plantarum]CCC79251.1 zinc metallopeptidase [Lactiplantibacillus plantarum WCFS1]MDE4415423.1 transcriptional regulator [Lactiplantibacillus plantarum]MDE4418000.1 transcriptional regulator [Lactiplantibacillus plantarum]MDE4422553.1 transcriptional regulator [Lactiplantibacillus plantarum]